MSHSLKRQKPSTVSFLSVCIKKTIPIHPMNPNLRERIPKAQIQTPAVNSMLDRLQRDYQKVYERRCEWELG